MDQKDKLALSEHICAFFLVFFVIALFGNILFGYNLFLIAALASGFTFSWLNRKLPSLWAKIFVTLGTVGIFGWMVYSVINSSLYYKEVILFCIKAALLLEAVVSFDSSNASLLSQMEALTIPLCMGFPIFTEEYTPSAFISIGGYFLSWLILLRIKFYTRFALQRRTRLVKSQANIFAASIFVLATLGAWTLYSIIPLETLQMRGIFTEKSKAGIDIAPDLLEKDYYGLQEQINKMIVDRHIPSLSTSEERHEALKFLESLIRELPDTFEVDQAEQGLVSQFKLPGPGLEKASGENTVLLNKYVEIKTELNVNRLKENIIDVFKNNPWDIKGRLSALDQANKMQSARTFEEARKNNERLKSTIAKSSLEENLRTQALALARLMHFWKDFGLYRHKKDELKKELLEQKERKWRDELASLLAQIEKMHDLAEFDQVRMKIRDLRENAPADIKVFLDPIEEILYVRLGMVLSGDAKELKMQAQEQNLSGDRLLGFEENIEALVTSEAPQELERTYKTLQQRSLSDKIKGFKENKELAGVKTELLLNEEKARVKEALQANTPPDLQDPFLKELERIQDDEQEPQIISSFRYLDGYVEEFFKSGFVSGTDQKKLLTAMQNLEQLYIFRLKLRNEFEPQETPPAREEEKQVAAQEEQQQKQQTEKQETEPQSKQEKKLLQIKILPEYLELALGLERQFVAMGMYSDNSQEELTAKADWTCSDEKVARVLSGNASTLNIGTVKITAKFENIESKPATLVVKEAELTAIVIPFNDIRLPLWGKFALKADGYYTDHSRKDITDLVSWSAVPKPVIKVEKTTLCGLRLGKAKISAEYKNIQSPEVDVRVVLTLWVLFNIIFFIILPLVLLAALLLFIFFVLTRQREKKLSGLLRSNPKEAILFIYANALEVLSLFEPKTKGFSAPLSFARGVEKRFGIKDGVFLKLSAKYAEAKYSRHALNTADAQEAARQHNSFSNQLCGARGVIKLSLKMTLAILKRRPFFIHI
ncbi:MAG: Ig-like domain-containing protein [Candidatus Omnitrophica bacterium]|nr:Ig-like domain-containing protein [Candidatus Omnitrophota bacterium]